MAHIVQETLQRAAIAGLTADFTDMFHAGIIQAALDTDEHTNLKNLVRNLEALMKQRDAPELKLVAHPAFDRLLIHKVSNYYGLDSRPGDRGTHEVFISVPPDFDHDHEDNVRRRDRMKTLLELTERALADPLFPPASSRPEKTKKKSGSIEGREGGHKFHGRSHRSMGAQHGHAAQHGGYPARPPMLSGFPYLPPGGLAPGYLPMAQLMGGAAGYPALLGMHAQGGVDPSLMGLGGAYYLSGLGMAHGGAAGYVPAQPVSLQQTPQYGPAQGVPGAGGTWAGMGGGDPLAQAQGGLSPALLTLLRQQQQQQQPPGGRMDSDGRLNVPAYIIPSGPL